MYTMSRHKKIVFLVPHVHVAGGIAVVFYHAVFLARKGYDVTVVNMSGEGDIAWFPYINELSVLNFTHEIVSTLSSLSVVIATSWDTVCAMMEIFSAHRKVYFVQSDDRRFTEDLNIVAAITETYKTQCLYMTEAKWIQRWLKEEFGHDAYYVPNGIDRNVIVQKNGLRSSHRKRILLEGAIDVPFKGMYDAYSAVKDLDADIWVVSNKGDLPAHWHVTRFFHRVSQKEMADIYCACDIMVKMSRVEGFFGPPLEAMACSCSVVVGAVTGHDEYIVHGKNALVVNRGDVTAARQSVQLLLDDDLLRHRLSYFGRKTAQKWSWKRSSRMLERVWDPLFPAFKYYTKHHPIPYTYH